MNNRALSIENSIKLIFVCGECKIEGSFLATLIIGVFVMDIMEGIHTKVNHTIHSL